MAFLESPRFPETIAYGAVGGPLYQTSVVTMWGGDEQRNRSWQYPRHQYELGLAVRTDTDTRALYAFFNAIARGTVNGFRFPDFNPGEALCNQEPLGLGAGDSTAYQIRKRYETMPYVAYRLITKPVAGTVRVFVDAVETSSFTVDTETGLVTINATEGAVLTVSCTFDVPVRFASDRLTIQRVQGGYLWDSITLLETREIA